MSRTSAYHRPNSIEAAMDLLGSSGNEGAPRVILGGGTLVNSTVGENREVVDLQALGLDSIVDEGASLSLGAMARLQDIVDDERVPVTVRDAARAEQPSAMRTVATIGGTVGAKGSESLLLAALLAYDAEVAEQSTAGIAVTALDAWLASPPRAAAIITSVTIAADGVGATTKTGRTPADVPIVAAVGRRGDSGTTVALTGVADTPVTVDPSDPTSGLSPAGDFRGSPEYRLQLASILTARVVKELNS